jgi:hypothetical protein
MGLISFAYCLYFLPNAIQDIYKGRFVTCGYRAGLCDVAVFENRQPATAAE